MPTASSLPPGAKPTARATVPFPPQVARSFPATQSYTLASPLKQPMASVCPSGAKATAGMP